MYRDSHRQGFDKWVLTGLYSNILGLNIQQYNKVTNHPRQNCQITIGKHEYLTEIYYIKYTLNLVFPALTSPKKEQITGHKKSETATNRTVKRFTRKTKQSKKKTLNNKKSFTHKSLHGLISNTQISFSFIVKV